MEPEMFYVSPRIAPAGETSEISIRGNLPQNHLTLFPGLTADSAGGDGLFTNGDLPGFTCGNGFDLKRPPFEPVPVSGPRSIPDTASNHSDFFALNILADTEKAFFTQRKTGTVTARNTAIQSRILFRLKREASRHDSDRVFIQTIPRFKVI